MRNFLSLWSLEGTPTTLINAVSKDTRVLTTSVNVVVALVPASRADRLGASVAVSDMVADSEWTKLRGVSSRESTDIKARWIRPGPLDICSNIARRGIRPDGCSRVHGASDMSG